MTEDRPVPPHGPPVVGRPTPYEEGAGADRPGRAERMRMEMPGLGTDAASVLKRVEALERMLERGFTVPGMNRPVGLDAILGLIPVFGDLMAAAMGSYILWEARNLGIPKWKIWRMAGNIGIDTALGAVPLVGDAFDFFFRSNTKNLRIIRRHLEKHHPELKTIDG